MFEQMFFLFQNTEAEPEVEYERFYDLILQGGPLGVAIVVILLFLSIIALYIFVERWFTIKRAGKMDENFINNIRAAVAAGNLEREQSLYVLPPIRQLQEWLKKVCRELVSRLMI